MQRFEDLDQNLTDSDDEQDSNGSTNAMVFESVWLEGYMNHDVNFIDLNKCCKR